MNRYLFVVNPHAGRGAGRKVGERVTARLRRDNFRHDVVYTREAGEARRLAAEADADVVVAVGGDGTVNEVVNGISDSRKKLAIIPAGSGNDVIKSLKIPRKIDDALETIKTGVLRIVDTALIECSVGRERKKESRLFLNGAGLGFDASVARRVTSIRRLRGTLLYLVAVLGTLKEYSCPTVEIQADGTRAGGGKKLLVSFGNGACAGGGFYLTPRAVMDDGLLDVCSLPALTVTGILGIIPRVLRGTHVSMAGIDYLQGKSFSVSSTAGFSVHVDGEVLAGTVYDVSVRLKAGSLEVLVPQ